MDKTAVTCVIIPMFSVLLVLSGLVIYQNRRAFRSLRSRLGFGLGVKELARRMKMEESALRSVEVQYNERRISKRRGGERRLQVPHTALMATQQKLLRLVLGKLNFHGAAHGFCRGRSIVTNANVHAGRATLVKLDIRDFFPSTRSDRVEKYFRRIGWNREAARLLTRLTTYEGGLPQGAPTSPCLSNLVNRRMDAVLSGYAWARRAVYTRYADDITFSFFKDIPSRHRGVIQRVRRVLQRYGYVMHEEKTRILRGHQQKKVTGLVVHDMANLPRATRRWLRAVRHRRATGGGASLSAEQLKGWSALERMIELQAKAPEGPRKRRRKKQR